ncbi:MAG TPA: lasso peptide biosynthesis B2 protein [Polyangiaceae bacterium]|nr:lasso peptide biosynthesis B2 protein [Polyangiaceae bacterium]
MLRRASALLSLTWEERRFLAAAWALAPWASLAIRRRGLRAVLARLETMRDRSADGGSASPPIDVARAEYLVRAAFRRTHADPRCLPQSVVQYVLQLRWGPTPRLVVGVVEDKSARDLDRFAHAWVEAEAGPRREPSFAPILELTPTRGVHASSEAAR